MTATGTHISQVELGNGLRVVCLADPSAPSIAVAVTYGVGHRDEQPGLEGCAHLFEHLMFEGSPKFAPGRHFTLLQERGGIVSAYTGLDYTQYYQLVPPEALALTLELEADRMAGIRLTAEAVRRQVKIISAEVRGKIAGRPYGGFSWQYAPQVLFRKWANTHQGFTDNRALADLAREQANAFFERHYGPDNAVLTVAGNVEAARVGDLAEHCFGRIAARGRPPRPDLDESWADGPAVLDVPDALAPYPAVAPVWRVPDRRVDRAAHLRFQVLAALLSNGHGALLRRHLAGAQVRAQLGVGGDPLETVDPSVFAVNIVLGEWTEASALAVLWDVLENIAEHGPDDEARSAGIALSAAHFEKIDSTLNLARMAGWLALHGEDVEDVHAVGEVYRTTTSEDLAQVATTLLHQPRRLVRVVVEGR